MLQKKGKSLGKAWRVRIRRLLSETFSALGAPKLDGTRCQTLEDQIVRELSWLNDPSSISEEALVSAYEATLGALDGMSKPSFGNIPGNIDKEKQHFVDASADEVPSAPREQAPLPEVLPDLPSKTASAPSPAPAAPKPAPAVAKAEPEPVAEPDAPEPAPTKTKKKKSKKSALRDILFSDDYDSPKSADVTFVPEPSASAQDTTVPEETPAAPPAPELPKYTTKETPPEIGYFDIVNIQIRQAIIIEAAVKPVRIGHAGDIADEYAETVNTRVERFIEVLSKPDSSIQFNSELTPGYEDDLIENMPDRGLVLHPKKKKKSSSLF